MIHIGCEAAFARDIGLYRARGYDVEAISGVRLCFR